MRGYGSWSIGWNEKNSNPSPPNNGCFLVLIAFGVLFLITSIQTSLETGSLFAIILGIAVLGGIIKGINDVK